MESIDKLANSSYKRHTGNSLSSSSRIIRRADLTLIPEIVDLQFSQVAWFLLLHVPLLFIFREVPIIATIHSLFVLGVGFLFMMIDKHPIRVMWVAAYITGSEILWRGVEAAIFWEYGKYATLLLCLVAIIKFRLLGKMTFWPFLFVALLVPGVIIVQPGLDRQDLAFQLSGLVTMAVTVLAFSTMEFKRKDLQQLFVMLIAPNIAMVSLMMVTIATQNIVFNGGSNQEVTGGIGPNQVSTSLSLGAMVAFYYIFLIKKDLRTRSLMIGLTLVMLTMSVLTFSRGGLWTTIGALSCAIPFLIRNPQQRLRVVSLLVITGGLAYFLVLPFVDGLTGGELLARFTNLDSTGRDVIFQIDYQIFLKNPITGIGVGQSVLYHPLNGLGFIEATHTEYGRLLAEHGIFGVLIIVILLMVTLFRALSHKSSIAKALSTGFSVWTLIYMLHAATRMVAPSFIFGLAAANICVDDEVENFGVNG